MTDTDKLADLLARATIQHTPGLAPHSKIEARRKLDCMAPTLAAEVLRLTAANAALTVRVDEARGALVFSNADATPKNCSIICDPESVDAIMDWYGAYFSGDRYTVSFNGRNIAMDQNGEARAWLAGKDGA